MADPKRLLALVSALIAVVIAIITVPAKAGIPSISTAIKIRVVFMEVSSAEIERTRTFFVAWV